MTKRCNRLTKIFIKYHENQQGGTRIKNKYRFLANAHFVSYIYLVELERLCLIDYIDIAVHRNRDNTFSLIFYRLDNIENDTLLGLLRIHGIC